MRVVCVLGGLFCSSRWERFLILFCGFVGGSRRDCIFRARVCLSRILCVMRV